VAHQVDLMIAMGPVAKVSNMESPIRYLAPFVYEIEYLFWCQCYKTFTSVIY